MHHSDDSSEMEKNQIKINIVLDRELSMTNMAINYQGYERYEGYQD